MLALIAVDRSRPRRASLIADRRPHFLKTATTALQPFDAARQTKKNKMAIKETRRRKKPATSLYTQNAQTTKPTQARTYAHRHTRHARNTRTQTHTYNKRAYTLV